MQLTDFALFLAAAVVAVPLFKRLKLGAVLGYLAAGVVIGPSGLGFITSVHSIFQLSSFGVVLLLFVIGLELQPARLWRLRGSLLGSGGAQVAVTAVLFAGCGVALGFRLEAAAIAGFGLALSSTALVLQLLSEQKALNTKAGRTAFAVLLFQDLAVIPVLALLAAPPGRTLDAASMLKGLAAVGLVIVGGRYLLRPLLRLVAATQMPEVFTAAGLLIVIGVSLAMDAVGLSASLGAFLAGVLLADSEYRNELQADIEPFKGLLMGLFFISVGMTADFRLVFSQPLAVLVLVSGLIGLKAAVLWVVGRFNGLRREALALFAASLAQGGEFAYVLFGIAGAAGFIDAGEHDLLVVAVTLSMLATPPLVMLALKLGRDEQPSRPYDELAVDAVPVVIAGFGPFGQIIGRLLRLRRIPFTVLEKDWQHVDFVRQFGGGVFYSDATRLEVLRAARVDRARIFVLAIANTATSLAIAETVRRHFPQVRLYAVARDRQHEMQLRKLGAHRVIRRHYGSSLEMSEHLLRELGDSDSRARRTVTVFREHDEATLVRQFALMGDERAQIQTALAAARELEELFAADETSAAREAA